MFGDNKASDPNEVEVGHASTLTRNSSSGRAAVSIQRASLHRLAELVHHLSDVPETEARCAVRLTGHACDSEDPLSIVAAALIELRRKTHGCISA